MPLSFVEELMQRGGLLVSHVLQIDVKCRSSIGVGEVGIVSSTR